MWCQILPSGPVQHARITPPAWALSSILHYFYIFYQIKVNWDWKITPWHNVDTIWCAKEAVVHLCLCSCRSAYQSWRWKAVLWGSVWWAPEAVTRNCCSWQRSWWHFLRNDVVYIRHRELQVSCRSAEADWCVRLLNTPTCSSADGCLLSLLPVNDCPWYEHKGLINVQLLTLIARQDPPQNRCMHKSLSCLGGGNVRARRIGQWRLPEAVYGLQHVHPWHLAIAYRFQEVSCKLHWM